MEAIQKGAIYRTTPRPLCAGRATCRLVRFVALWRLAKKLSGPVTDRASRNQVFFDIISLLAARAAVMDSKILRCAAILAAPSVACQFARQTWR